MSKKILEIHEGEGEGQKRLGFSSGEPDTERGKELLKEIQKLKETEDYWFE